MKKYLSLLVGALLAGPVFADKTVDLAAVQTKGVFSDVVLANQDQRDKKTQMSIDNFKDAVAIIRSEYVMTLSDAQIFDKAIAGLLSELDPHSEYLDEEKYKALSIATSGEFVGVGAEVTMENGLLEVVSPLDDSPAQKAGLKSGDYILQINQTPIQGMSLDEAMKLIRGQSGTSLTLTVLRKGVDKPILMTLTRSSIKMTSVKEELLDNHYGYIRISSFQESTPEDLHRAIDNLLNKTQGNGLRGVILDLRNNPGGLLPASIKVADDFLDTTPEENSKTDSSKKDDQADKDQDDNLIVAVKGRGGVSELSASATPGDLVNGVPVVVLINQGSASASEIVAAALQDHHRAVVLGEKSFGKGSVQTVIPLSDGKTAVKITTARFYSPSGRPIQGEGVTPDVVVPQMELQKTTASNNAPQDLGGLNYREMNLQGALTPERPEALAQESTQPETSEIKMGLAAQNAGLPSPSTDYQVGSALNILKGLYVAELSQKAQQVNSLKASEKKSAPRGADSQQIAEH